MGLPEMARRYRAGALDPQIGNDDPGRLSNWPAKDRRLR